MCVRLTLAVLGVHGVSIVTGLADLTARSSGVEQAPQTLPRHDVTVARLAHVHVTVTVAAHTGAAHHLWVTIETTCTPTDTEGEASQEVWASGWGAGLQPFTGGPGVAVLAPVT